MPFSFIGVPVSWEGARIRDLMLQTTIAEIEDRIRKADSVTEEKRAELLSLVASLKAEIDQLSRTHEDRAVNIAGLTRASADEATRRGSNPERVQSALDDLSASVTEFEGSHPTLVQVVNRICTTLSNLGI